MDDRIRRVAYRKTQNEDIFKEVQDDFVPVEGEDVSSIEIEEEETDIETSTVDKFRSRTDSSPDDSEFDMGRIRERGWESKDISFEDNTGVEFDKESDSLQQRMEKIETINNKLAEKGINRRYVLGESQAPANATVFEDGIGKYYYEVDNKIRPSHVTKVVEEDSWFNLSQDGRKLATIKLLNKVYPWLTHEAKSDSELDSFLERALVSEIDDLENENVFSVEKIDEIKSLLLNR